MSSSAPPSSGSPDHPSVRHPPVLLAVDCSGSTGSQRGYWAHAAALLAALEARAAAWGAKNLRAQLIELGAEPNLLQLAQSVPQLSTLVTAVTAAGIGSVLAGKGPLTVFAPNSESAR